MDLKGKKLILASNSPRRKELMTAMGLDFTVDTGTRFREKYPPGTPHEIVPQLMSEGKSEGFHRPLHENEILITADTMVLCGDQILGKPRSHSDEVRMLRLLSGGEHQVITAITLRDAHRQLTQTDTARVWFKPLADEEIDFYLDHFHPHDKAGSYGIQEWIGYIGITHIEGSFYNIVGLPTHLLYSMLQEFV